MIAITIVSCLIAAAVADSVRYQVHVTPIQYDDDSQFTHTGAARLVTLNLGLENCAAPTATKPCGWGMQRSAGYAKHTGETFYSGGQRNAFGVAKANTGLAGFWADASQTDDLPGDLITAEKDLRVEYANFDARFKTPKTLVNGIHQGSAPIYVNGDMDLTVGGEFGSCLRLFDNQPAERPNSFDLIGTGAYASGKPASVDSDVVFGFWKDGVVGRMADADAFYRSNEQVPQVTAHAADEAAARAVLGARASLALDGVAQQFAQPVFGVDGADIANDDAGVAGFCPEPTAVERRAALFPLVYHAARDGANDQVRQACSINAAGECVFRPVAYVHVSPCALQKRQYVI